MIIIHELTDGQHADLVEKAARETTVFKTVTPKTLLSAIIEKYCFGLALENGDSMECQMRHWFDCLTPSQRNTFAEYQGKIINRS